MILFALLIIVGILALLWKLPQKKLFGLNVWFDIAIIGFLTVFLHGTALGMITGPCSWCGHLGLSASRPLVHLIPEASRLARRYQMGAC